MGYFSIFGGGGVGETCGTATGSTTNTTISNGGVANTKGSWVELVASTGRNATGIIVEVAGGSVVNQDHLFDIGVGANGSEVVRVANLHVANNASVTAMNARCYHLPIRIPAGTRISARQQSTSTTATIALSVQLVYGGIHTPSWSVAETLGTDTSTSLNVAFSHPASNNTKGSYVQIKASTARRYTGLIIHGGKGQANASQGWMMDLAIGAAASEKILIPNIGFSQNTTTDALETSSAGPFLLDIPSGTRIAARIQIDVTGSGRDFWASVIGLA